MTYKAYLRKQAQDQLKEIPSSSQPEDISSLLPLAQQPPEAPAAQPETTGPMIGGQGRITQRFGNVNPAIERFSRGGVNIGTDIGLPVGTSTALPPGKWKLLSSYGQAKEPGYIGDHTNGGYGNSALFENLDTGEKLRFSHLQDLLLDPSVQEYQGGSPIGHTGQTGNVTGPHLDLEYYDKNGKLADVLQSAYAQYLNLLQ